MVLFLFHFIQFVIFEKIINFGLGTVRTKKGLIYTKVPLLHYSGGASLGDNPQTSMTPEELICSRALPTSKRTCKVTTCYPEALGYPCMDIMPTVICDHLETLIKDMKIAVIMHREHYVDMFDRKREKFCFWGGICKLGIAFKLAANLL